MKKILEKTIPFMIGSFMCMPINYLYQFSWIQAFLISLTISIAYFIAIVLVEKVYPILKTKNPFKRLWFWLRYKRVKEIKMKSCYGCILNDDNKCKRRDLNLADKCVDTMTIVTKRSYNPLNWLKKLFGILVIALLFSSCSVYVNCNFNKVPKYKTTQQDSTVLMINEYWF